MDASAFRVAALLVLVGALAGCAPTPRAPGSVRVIPLGAADQPYVELLGGHSGAVSMESGAVSLAPGKTVGVHDTEDYEELVIPLEGRGELRVPGHPPIAIAPGVVAYAPPHTPHDVANVGDTVFRYVFVAATTGTPRMP
jgi:quercetin dioxygenase-like cupin family protein